MTKMKIDGDQIVRILAQAVVPQVESLFGLPIKPLPPKGTGFKLRGTGKFKDGGVIRSTYPESARLPLDGEHVIPKSLADRLARRQSEMMGSAILGSAGATVTSNVTVDQGEPLTLEKLMATMDKVREEIGMLPMLASSRDLPADRAVSFRFEGRDYCGAHPDLWDKVPKEAGIGVEAGLSVTSICDNEIIDLDEETPKGRKARGTFWHAMAGAMIGESK